ncbi:MAG: phospho-N-acetylmuramoyl-pentapeptide-transferase [Clostridiales bacterium]|nr:phospho-N-acetylmuramoyl-pentapeptide-transferase [Clostridiales bacterium]
MGLSFIITFLTTALFGRLLIPLLQKLKFGQIVRNDGPKTHLSKMGIPTIGGIMFIIPILLFATIFNKFSIDSIIISIIVLLFSLVGFLDDLLKIKRKSKDGLSVLQKTIGLLIVSTLFATYFVYFSNIGTELIAPFSNMMTSFMIPKFLYVLFIIIVMYAATNSVNLSDGVDGLASSVTAIVMMCLMLIAFVNINNELVIIFSISTVGGLLAFLLYNGHPAKVFMGDTGSLGLGALVGIMAIYLKIPWVLLIAGIVYVVEALSVIIQVGHYKRTKRRVFKMAPIHHHFELSGWKEAKVVVVFTTVTIVACALSYAILVWL